MPKINEILSFLYSIAPHSLAEEWDNVGLLVGDGTMDTTNVLISLDITTRVVNEAVLKGANLIISHHPVIFKSLNAVTKQGKGNIVFELVQNGISAICMHTNLDLCNNGVNDALAIALELEDIKILKSNIKHEYKKIVVFAPREYSEQIRIAMINAGAGRLSNYDSCAFESQGNGFFRPLDGANPFIGTKGIVEKIDEVKIEVLCSRDNINDVMSAMKKTHPYEMPAYDIFNNEAVNETFGLGRMGKLKKPMALDDFAVMLKKKLDCSGVMLCDSCKNVELVAVSGGSDDGSLVQTAAKLGADTLVIGELKHYSQIEALEAGINVVIAGHYETENVICPHMCKLLSVKFKEVDFEISSENKSPVRMLM
jgi:dinuclear metal center YbgI/SA1388 family protein